MGSAHATDVVIERVRAERSHGRRAADGARREDERRVGEVLSTASHEMRTPLTCIRGALGLLEMLSAGELSPRARQVVEIARRNSERLLLLVEELLDLERLQSGAGPLDVRTWDVTSLLRDARDLNQPGAAERHVNLALEGLEPAFALVDAAAFSRVLTNLISNAVKFSPPDGIVRLAAARGPGYVRVTVQDEGPGISEAFRSRVFERFAREPTGPPGTGLGLSISRALVERMGGRLGFETGAGTGTTFCVDVRECPER